MGKAVFGVGTGAGSWQAGVQTGSSPTPTRASAVPGAEGARDGAGSSPGAPQALSSSAAAHRTQTGGTRPGLWVCKVVSPEELQVGPSLEEAGGVFEEPEGSIMFA